MKQPADSCATVQELLLDYAYGELEGASRKDVEAHVAGCASCRIALTQMTGTRSLMAELTPEPAPEAGLESLLAYADQAAKHRAAEAKAPRAGRIWSWLAPSLGFASAAAVALLFVVKPGGDPTRALQPALPAAIQSPAPVASPKPSPVAAMEPARLDEARPKAEGKLESAAKEFDRLADKNAEVAEPAKAPAAKAMRKAKGGGSVGDDFESTFGANEPAGGRVAKDSKPEAVAPAQALAQAEPSSQALAEDQRVAAEGERAGGGGEAIGSPNWARQRAQAPQYGYVPADDASSKTASAGMSNVSPLDGAKPAPMPAPKPAAPPPPATSGYAEAKKRDAREEQAPMAPEVAVADAPAKAEPPEDRAAATKSNAVALTPEQLLRKGADQSNNGDLAGAEATYATFLRLHPNHPKAPDVALWRVALLERMGRTGDAALARAEYVRRWPNIGTGSPAGSSGPRDAAASPARAAPAEKAKAADFDAATEAAR